MPRSSFKILVAASSLALSDSTVWRAVCTCVVNTDVSETKSITSSTTDLKQVPFHSELKPVGSCVACCAKWSQGHSLLEVLAEGSCTP